MSFAKYGVLVGVLTLASTATSIFAHHSISSEFDASKEGTVTGVLTRVDWVNPHTYTYVDVTDVKTGKVESWAFEGNPPATYRRAGIKKTDWKIGQMVKVTFAAAKDGTKHLGFLKMVKYQDGHTMVFRVGGE